MPNVCRLSLFCLILTQVDGNMQKSTNIENVKENRVLNSTDCDCGRTSFNSSCKPQLDFELSNRIYQGSLVKDGEVPWMAYIEIRENLTDLYSCGGTLLNALFVLTAAHCLMINGLAIPANDVFIFLGENNLDNFTNYSEYRMAEQIIIHEKYEAINLMNDIALIKTNESVQFSKRIKPVCIPEDVTARYERSQGIICGWGKTSFGGKTSQKLLEIGEYIISNFHNYCKNNNKLPNMKITREKMCAYSVQGAFCDGDSGGGLTIDFKNRCTTIGIAIVNKDCGRTKEYADIYTRVSDFSDWIRDHAKTGGCF